MNIAIITGASSGVGREFIKQAITAFPEIEEFWLIARRKDKIEDSIKDLKGNFSMKHVFIINPP